MWCISSPNITICIIFKNLVIDSDIFLFALLSRGGLWAGTDFLHRMTLMHTYPICVLFLAYAFVSHPD